MINNDRILNAVFALYEKRKNDSENKAYEINNFLNTDKNWEQNRYQIKDISMQIAKAEYFGESINIEALKEKREFLKQERAKLSIDLSVLCIAQTIPSPLKSCISSLTSLPSLSV